MNDFYQDNVFWRTHVILYLQWIFGLGKYNVCRINFIVHYFKTVEAEVFLWRISLTQNKQKLQQFNLWQVIYNRCYEAKNLSDFDRTNDIENKICT